MRNPHCLLVVRPLRRRGEARFASPSWTECKCERPIETCTLPWVPFEAKALEPLSTWPKWCETGREKERERERCMYVYRPMLLTYYLVQLLPSWKLLCGSSFVYKIVGVAKRKAVSANSITTAWTCKSWKFTIRKNYSCLQPKTQTQTRGQKHQRCCNEKKDCAARDRQIRRLGSATISHLSLEKGS